MITYKEGIDILDMLKQCGFTTYILRKRQIFGQSTIQKQRAGGLPSWQELDIICDITAYDVGEILEYRQDSSK